jgi:peptidyl-prolyl cis-trans isomerase SurA
MTKITKKIVLFILIISLLSFYPIFSQMMLQPVATVNLVRSEMISKEELDAKRAELSAANDGQEIDEKDVLDIMVNDALVLQGAERDGVVLKENDLNTLVAEQKSSVESQLGRKLSDAEFNAVLNQAYNLTLAEFREKVEQNYIVNAYIRKSKSDLISNIPAPTEAEIQSFYRKNASSFINPEYVRLSHIYISKNDTSNTNPEEKANDIYRQLQFGKTFDELVISSSQDESSKFIGGEIGWMAIDDSSTRQVFGDAFVDAVFEMETDEISSVLESKTGYHIVKVLEHIYPKMLTINDRINPDSKMTVRQYISQTLYVEKQQVVYKQAVSELVSELRAEAEIKILL